jgi:methylase of polypeptide subunit release factors
MNKSERLSFGKRVVKRLFPFYLPLAQFIRGHPLLIRWLFKVHLRKSDRVTWDFTTLVLKYALRKRVLKNGSVLEIGVGQAALLSIYMARTFGIKADGIDIVADRVKHSKQVARYNSIPIRIWQSDFFQHVDNTYDLIHWNASYIPTDFGKEYNLTHRVELGNSRAWDGGSDGTDAINRFLSQAPFYLTPDGEILLGVNRFYVPQERITRIIQNSSLVVSDCISRPLNPSLVYVLRHKEIQNEK